MFFVSCRCGIVGLKKQLLKRQEQQGFDFGGGFVFTVPILPVSAFWGLWCHSFVFSSLFWFLGLSDCLAWGFGLCCEVNIHVMKEVNIFFAGLIDFYFYFWQQVRL